MVGRYGDRRAPAAREWYRAKRRSKTVMTSHAPAPSKRLIELPDKLTGLPEAPFAAQNALRQHPLFEPERIKRLLRTLPRERVEIRSVQRVGNSDEGYKRGALLRDADPVDTFERLEEK